MVKRLVVKRLVVKRLPAPQRGYTYLGLLFAVALAGTALATVGTVWRTEAQREREEQLLFAGDQIRDAIAAYWEKTPAGQPQALPRTLEQLLDDKRWPATRRHLRQRYRDPMTNSADWGLIEGPGGSIAGVYSLGEGAPLKRAHFAAGDEAFADARSYRDWRFVFSATASRAASAPAP